MNKSESIAALAAALSKAQGEMGSAKKDAMNPHFRSKYADLASVWEAARAPLSKHGLSVVQTNEDSERGVCVETTLMHSSGEWISGRLTLPVSKGDAQGFGSAMTYARRYGLAAILSIAADDDDDGEASVRIYRRAPEPPPSATGLPEPAAKRDWEAFTKGIVDRIATAASQDAVNKVAKEVNLAKPPKAFRDAIGEAYMKKISALSAEVGHATGHGQ